MFIKAIQCASEYTRSIHTISKNYGSKDISVGSATLFFVNEDGYAITCKHVAEMIIQSEKINQHYQLFKQHVSRVKDDVHYDELLSQAEQSFQIQKESTVQLKVNFVNCVDRMDSFSCHLHPFVDLAIIKFNGYHNIQYHQCATFIKDKQALQVGKFLCRVGYPFPEFNNYTYDANKDEINWTQEGIQASPLFPIEGMLTRFLGDSHQGVFGIEMSTPGLRGQSGGPLMDENGIVYGMQYSTKHLHLGFDLEEKEIMVDNKIKKVSDYSFIHLGQCIHVDIIKDFLKQHQVSYYEA